LNTPGAIDADYRGEVKVVVVDLGQEDYRGGIGTAELPSW
jgi:dUTP pyrophosphatase